MKTDFNIPGAKFCRFLVDRISACGSGAAEDGEYISPDRPRDRFFIGRLSPGGETSVIEEILESTEDFLARLNPCMMRMRFLLRGEPDTKILLNPSFHLYVRVFPDYDRQKKDAELVFARGDEAQIMPAFRRVRPSIQQIDLRLDEIAKRQREIPVSWDTGALAQVPNVFRGTAPYRIPKVNLESEQSYQSYINTLTGAPVLPNINVSVIASVESVPNEEDIWEISLSLVNRSNDSDPSGKDRMCDEVIFDVGFHAKICKGFVIPYEFPALPKSYRFDRRMFGTGVNCSVVAEGEDPWRPTVLSTKVMPTFEQPRFDHREFADIAVTFRNLAGVDAETILRRIAAKMKIFDAEDWEEKGRRVKEGLPGSEQEVEEFERDRKAFGNEILRFEKGIECLSNSLVSRAFALMNETFRLMGEEKGRDRWRLFQVVFIVSLLPSIVGREFPEFAEVNEWEFTDVIWFPTGGGKTEAYLGLTVFGLFFDRLRGKDRGVTALYRFPLRLLSLQQFQRIVKTVAAANRIKNGQKIRGRSFTVGHWIGSGGSPNKIKEDEGKEFALNPQLIQKYRKLAECPNPGCGSRGIQMKFDLQLMSLQHVCPKCGVLPVLIVDDELYRYLPSVVVGTVDKMAIFGMQRRFANLIGWTRGFCNDHGYAPEDECEVCKKKNLPLLPIKDPVPAIHVQDELHLLKEDLGAFDSHYETSVMELQTAIPDSKLPWKIIAATATIEEYERHVEHLYLQRGRRFPTSGPSYDNTFFAKTDSSKISRFFAGVLPSGLTHINAMVSILWYFHREISRLRSLSADEFLSITGTEDLLAPQNVPNFLDQYEICLDYVLTKKSGDQMAESLDAQVGSYLMENGLPELVGEVLSGGTSSEKITDVMERIEKLDLNEPDTSRRIRSVIATSMISHGVDVERFNFITFFGMPRMTSEYIQASSRVGRTFPGIVLVCFAPARERDRSHYHLFAKYHEYLERLVEPAAINRWSRFSIRKTIPGVVLGYIFNELARETEMRLTTEKKLKEIIPENFSRDKLFERIVAYYGAENQTSGEFQDIIEDQVAMFFNGLSNSTRFLGKRPGWKPMRSLRDTDREVVFRPARAAADLFELILKDKISGGELETQPEDQGDSNE